jgi:hypothetical protein
MLVAIGRRLGWTRPVAWLGATMGIAGSLLFAVALLPSFGDGSRATQAQYEELAVRMAATGRPLDASAGPIISNFPIWIAETQRVSALALPDEPATDVLDLASDFGASLVVIVRPESRFWPSQLDEKAPGTECFWPIDLGPYAGAGPDPLAGVTVYEIDCPGGSP